MLKFFKCGLILLSLLLITAVGSQTVPADFQVGAWKGFCTAAISFTFDDGCPNQFARAIPLFDEFGCHLTLFTVTRSSGMGLPNWSKLQSAAASGHEIAAHTLTHTTFAGMSDSLQTLELRDCQMDIDAHISGQKCATMAYPFCVTGDKALCAQYYIAARICSGVIESRSPRDFMAISSIVCGTEGSVKTADNFIARAASAVKSKGWCIFLLHGVDNDGGYSPVPSTVLRETLVHLNSNQADYWVDSFGNVARYIKERDAVSITETEVTDSSITVQITDMLQDDIFNVPLTIRRILPAGWGAATVQQNDILVETKTVRDGATYVQFSAIPDQGPVVILKSSGTHIQDKGVYTAESPYLWQNYPNPFNPTTTIRFHLAKADHASVKIFDALGKEIRILLDEELIQGEHTLQFHSDGLESGVYFCRLTAGSFHQHRKMVLLR